MRLFNRGEEYFAEYGDLEIPLGQDNYIVQLNRDSPFMDCAQVQDPTDGDYFTYWRSDLDEEVFESMVDVAMDIGTFILRQTPFEGTEANWDAMHRVDDQVLEEFLSDEQ